MPVRSRGRVGVRGRRSPFAEVAGFLVEPRSGDPNWPIALARSHRRRGNRRRGGTPWRRSGPQAALAPGPGGRQSPKASWSRHRMRLRWTDDVGTAPRGGSSQLSAEIVEAGNTHVSNQYGLGCFSRSIPTAVHGQEAKCDSPRSGTPRLRGWDPRPGSIGQTHCALAGLARG